MIKQLNALPALNGHSFLFYHVWETILNQCAKMDAMFTYSQRVYFVSMNHVMEVLLYIIM